MDWKAIKTEYITTNTSYRKLAEKYGVTYNNIGIVSRRENWKKLREEYNAKTVSKILAIESNKQATRMERLLKVSDDLLDAVEDALRSHKAGEIVLTRAEYKSLSSTIKDIKDIQNIKTELDIEEQKARIANLKRQAEKDVNDTDESYGVVLMPAIMANLTPPKDDDDG